MSYLQLLWLVLPSVAVATVMLFVNARVSRAATRRMFGDRAARPLPAPQVRPRLPLPPAERDPGDSIRLVLA